MSQSDVVTLQRSDNSSCKIHIFGATVFSWVNKGEEIIFVSSKSHFDKKKAIRGGIPVVFPHFGPWELGPQHGFARINSWETNGPSQDGDGNPQATFTLQNSADTEKMWNYRFKLTYTVTLLEDKLKINFDISNTDTKEFDFTCLLHTYIRVPDVTKISVSGLKGLEYEDKLRDGNTFTEDRDLVTVSENVDRAYKNTPPEHQISQAAGGRTVLIQKTNLPDTVVWNPWKEKAAAMSDFGDAEYMNMVCVEAGFVSQNKSLPAGQAFQAAQTISVI